LDVVRAVVESGRENEVVVYTGNDDSIVFDLLARYRMDGRETRIVGGLLGQWAIGTASAVNLLESIKRWRTAETVPAEVFALANQLTDLNAAVFDAANDFAGCIPGIHEVLRRQGLLEGVWCLDPREQLSPHQQQEIDRVERSYPNLLDESFIAEHVDEWLS
jgi:hypothetical protein